jgi:methylmalonyl-CoA mutase
MNSDHSRPDKDLLPGENPDLKEFPAPPYDRWREAVERQLRGRSFDEAMMTETIERIRLQPLYRRQDTADLVHRDTRPGQPPFVRGYRAPESGSIPWLVAQAGDCRSIEQFNNALREDLRRGQTAIVLSLDAASRAGLDPDTAPKERVGHDGLSLATLADLRAALDGIDLSRYPILARTGGSAVPLVAMLIALAEERGTDIGDLAGCIGIDPLGELATDGKSSTSLKQAYDEMAALARGVPARGGALRTIPLSTAAVHNAGADTGQELALAIATAVEYLRALEARGLGVEATAGLVQFCFSVGTDFFFEIAKLRAARLAWSRVMAACGIGESAPPMHLHCRTSTRYSTALDPHSNLLRATTEALAAVVGGCDSLQVGCFDEVTGPPNEFSRRLARNTQLILKDESHLDRVIDPAGGSWYVEWLTDRLAREAWRLFSDVESRGGLHCALKAGFIQEQLQRAAQSRAGNMARRSKVLVGTNRYPPSEEKSAAPQAADESFFERRIAQLAAYRDAVNRGEVDLSLKRIRQAVIDDPAGVLTAAVTAFRKGATLGEVIAALRFRDRDEAQVAPLMTEREALPFEKIHRAVTAFRHQNTIDPFIFLVALGDRSQTRDQRNFVTELLGVGGFEISKTGYYESTRAAAVEIVASKASVVVMCTSGESEEDQLSALAGLLRKDLPATVIVAVGDPGEQAGTLRAVGVDQFLFEGADQLEALWNLAAKMGIRV